MEAFEDPNHEGNSEKYHTGFKCIEKGCKNPAGTAWGKYWCFECNVKRMNRITESFNSLLGKMKDKSQDKIVLK